MPVSPIRAVIFDLDDTLLDTSHAMREALTHLGRTLPALHGETPEALSAAHQRILLTLDPDVFAGRLSGVQARARRFELLLREYGDEQTDGTETALLYRTAYRAAMREVAGAAKLMDVLRARGLRIGVLTNYLREVQLESLEAIALSGHVDALVTVSDAPPKPDPRAYAAVLDALGVQASEALMVGDSWENDVLGAQRAGLRTCWLNRFGAVRPAGSEGAAEIAELGEVVEFLDAIAVPDSL
ncbi:HAD family hydrolase [Deinococcus sp.]|uniref:HAD family hydrolase n=1 Tax=Deinococcus sp. TaxID=47478 RepID=UPI003B5A6FB5